MVKVAALNKDSVLAPPNRLRILSDVPFFEETGGDTRETYSSKVDTSVVAPSFAKQSPLPSTV